MLGACGVPWGRRCSTAQEWVLGENGLGLGLGFLFLLKKKKEKTLPTSV